jgi:hypothetical protein
MLKYLRAISPSFYWKDYLVMKIIGKGRTKRIREELTAAHKKLKSLAMSNLCQELADADSISGDFKGILAILEKIHTSSSPVNTVAARLNVEKHQREKYSTKKKRGCRSNRARHSNYASV